MMRLNFMLIHLLLPVYSYRGRDEIEFLSPLLHRLRGPFAFYAFCIDTAMLLAGNRTTSTYDLCAALCEWAT